nr:MAG TPA: hypothetical protein [Caudoviricetes sp.]
MIACLWPPFHVFNHILQLTVIKSNNKPPHSPTAIFECEEQLVYKKALKSPFYYTHFIKKVR